MKSTRDTAMRWAAAEAELRNASVRVVSSYDIPALYSGFDGTAVMMIDMQGVIEELRQHAIRTASGVFASHPSVDHDVEVVATGAASALLQADTARLQTDHLMLK